MHLAMASQATTHGVVDRLFGNRGFRHISMAPGARDTSLEMRRMAEFDMSVRREAINTYPGNLDIPPGVCANLLYFRFFLRQFCMTEHAFSNRRNTGSIADVGANMAIDALHPQFHVSVMRECDWLLSRSSV
jgi:hypothetical protein